jgi:hypothetical protein
MVTEAFGVFAMSCIMTLIVLRREVQCDVICVLEHAYQTQIRWAVLTNAFTVDAHKTGNTFH